MYPDESLAVLSTGQREELTQLITKAFQRAQDKGKSDWNYMTTAVLKNRLLAQTNGAFDEKQYGASRINRLLEALPELLEIDNSTRPPLVRFLPAPDAAATGTTTTQPATRIRDDLWNAVFDYSSKGAYVWRDQSAVWVPQPEGDDLVLPTLTPVELDGWRAAFAADHGGASLEAWAETGQGTLALPPELRPLWNRLLKEHTIHRLQQWFEQRSLVPPSDLTTDAAGPRKDEDAERLRRYLQRCIAAMTLEELRTLMIPATAAARLFR